MLKNKNTNKGLQDFEINIKFKLAALWASVTLLYLYGDYFELYIPGKVAGLISGENILGSPVKLLGASILLAIPSLMVCVSIIAKPLLNRWLNIVSGFLLSTVTFLIVFASVSSWRIFYSIYAFVETIITVSIIWYAFKWPRQSEITR